MSIVFEVLITNAAALTVLAALGWLVSRWVQRPAWLYLIWLSVLLRALAPPLLELPILPGDSIEAAPVPVVVGDTSVTKPVAIPVSHPAGGGTAKTVSEAAGTTGMAVLSEVWSITDALLVLWLVGSLSFLTLAGVRIRRFEQLLRRSVPAGEDLFRMGDQVAERLGIRCPPIRLVEGCVSPLVWYRPGTLLLVLPKELWKTLTRLEQTLLLAHELAHVKRNDHRVRLLELLTTACYWWHPVLRWSRARLREAEESCCDGEVLAQFPGQQVGYARSLYKVASFLSGARLREPQLASGAGSLPLEGRIRSIMNQRSILGHSPLWQKLALVVACGWALLLFPTQVESRPVQGGEELQALSGLQSETAELHKQMAKLRARQVELRGEQLRVQHAAESQRLEADIADLRSAGREEEALWLQKKLELLERRLQLEVRSVALEQEREIKSARLSAELESLHLDLGLANATGDTERVAQLKASAAEVESAFQEESLEFEERQASLRDLMLDLEDGFRSLEVERLRREGHGPEADTREAEIRLAREMRHLEHEHERTQRRLQRLEVLYNELLESVLKAAELRQQGRVDEAEKLERHIQTIRRKLESRSQG